MFDDVVDKVDKVAILHLLLSIQVIFSSTMDDGQLHIYTYIYRIIDNYIYSVSTSYIADLCN